MCIPGLDPITLAGLAASGAGALYNSSVQNDYIAEVNNQNQIAMDMEREARMAEEARQAEMEKLQFEAVSRSLFDANPDQLVESVEEFAANPTNEFVTAADEYNVPVLQGQTGEGPVAESIGRIVADAAERTKGILQAQSKLSHQNTQMQGIQDSIIRTAGDVSNIGSDRRGSLNVAQLETFVPPAQVTPSDSILGDLLMLGGQAAAGYGGKSVGMSGGDIFDLGGTFGTPNLTGYWWERPY